ncbi:MAG: PDZ domain-containing protein, partial [Planctomycetota bacterium]
MALSKFTTTSSLLVLSFFMGATANACQSTATAETTKTLTRVVQKDGQDDIEIRIENGTLTAKINGETIDASRVRKTDAGYDILAVDGSVMKSIAMQATPDATAGEYKVVIMRQDGANADIDENNEEVDVEVDLVAAPAPVMIGVQLGEVDEALCVHLAVDAAKSTILTGLKEGLPAAKSGLHRFDVVIGVGEGTDGSATAIREALATMKAGETVQLKVRRGAETLTIGVEVVATDLAAMAMPEEFEFEIEMDGEDGEDGADGGTQVIMVGPDGKPMRMQMPQGMQMP